MIPTIFSNRDRGLLAGAAAVFSVYLASAYPGVSPYRDSGDMAAAAWSLGVSHPPGYPLYLLLGRLCSGLLDFGSAAYRLHALSAAAGALAAAVLAWGVSREEEGLPGPAAAGLFLALTPACWHLALTSEMYSLNALVAAALFALAAAPGAERERLRRGYAAALLFGLGLGNHQTLLAAVPGLLWMMRGELFPDGALGRSSLRRVAAACGFFALGLSLYAYLPLRAAAEPVVSWGDAGSWRGFLRMLTRADYGGTRLHPERAAGLLSAGLWWPGLKFSARLFLEQLGAAGAIFACWGAWSARRRRSVQGALAAFFLSGPLFVVWANLETAKAETYPILEPHLVLPLVFSCALAGFGAADLARKARAKSAAAFAALWLAAGAVYVWDQARLPQALTARARLNTRFDFTGYDLGESFLTALPKDALLLDPDDPTAFTLAALRVTAGRRPDVSPILYFRTRWGYEQLKKRRPELLPAWEIGSGQELLGALVSKSLADDKKLFVDLPQKAPPGTYAHPAGLAYRISAASGNRKEREAQWDKARLLLAEFVRARPAPAGAGFFSRHAASYRAAAYNNLGIEAQALGRPAQAAGLYRRALTIDSGMAESWNNLGNAEIELGRLPAAAGAYRRAAEARPSAQVTYNLGRALLLAGDFAAAESAFRESIAAGGPVEAANDLGLVYLRTRRAREAVDLYRNLLGQNPQFLLGYYNLALAHESLGEKDQAFAAVRAYAELTPDPAEKAEARRWLEKLND